MPQLRVKIVIDTDQLFWWAAKHRELGHPSVDAVLTAAGQHYEGIDPDSLDGDDPPAPIFPTDLDGAELRHWADWHIDHGPAGVAHILFDAGNAKAVAAGTNRDEVSGE